MGYPSPVAIYTEELAEHRAPEPQLEQEQQILHAILPGKQLGLSNSLVVINVVLGEAQPWIVYNK